MTPAQQALDSATTEAERLRSRLAKSRTAQIRSVDDQSLIKATALTWFNTHRAPLEAVLGAPVLDPLDAVYKHLIVLSGRAASRQNCVAQLRTLAKALVQLASDHAVSLTKNATTPTSDKPPTFTPLVSDTTMQTILARRWDECVICINAGAPLAATVMMGGLLEALLLARVNSTPNKSSVFTASAAPKDNKTGQTLALKEWTLKNYIEVGHELGWLSHSAKDVSEILRDYRNYIHPQKQLSHSVTLRKDDAQMFWEVAKSIARQVLTP